jgi:signal transduction histidine kinase
VTVYASTTPGCGGLVHAMERADGSIAPPAQIATLVGLRLALALAIGVALVAFTAVPLVRRIRALSEAMNGIVDAGFDGEIEDPVPDELGDVARSFNAATASVREQLDRLEHRDAVMRRALADFAHDLRTPLTTLQLSTSSLPDTEASTMIRTELSYLHGMMQNFESVLVGEDGEVGTLALDSLVERVQHRFEPQARDRDVSLKVALPDATLHVEADVVLVERAVGNLVQNALRFARAHVVVLLFRDGEEARIEVRDDGPGFGPSLERAAERGVRGEDAEGVGLGLGLAIAETAARRFGGRLELRNDDEATLAAIVLPLAAV